MKTAEIRRAFIDYFQQQQHTEVASSSVIPADDPTLLFTNAGMVQFKDVFLGREQKPYVRAVSSQRCIRAGGKHNDLENVGYTARHHTFFEMLGNFSFGDYFKREAIQFAWQFLTDVLKIPAEKLWVTVYREDEETADIWLKEMKINGERFSRCGEKDNFWSMGDIGPCGPCTEIFYDHGPDVAGGPPGSPEEDGDRYVEVWNLVFMQFNRDKDGVLHPLPKPSVDTGMGLERIAAVMQKVHSNYEIDLFANLIQFIAHLAGIKNQGQASLKVIADHIRATSAMITDGVVPSNEGRGYVLRRIIRRALRHGSKLGFTQIFFHKLVAPLVKEMGEAYPELAKKQFYVEQTILREEEQFEKTLQQGLRILSHDMTQVSDNIIPGDVVFKLYDTYGFPPDLTADIAREHQMSIDMAGFDLAMAKQRKQSQAASQFGSEHYEQLDIVGETQFTGYQTIEHAAKITALIHQGKSLDQLSSGDKGIIILDQTPFYAESGGQVGDKGIIRQGKNIFVVEDTQKQGKIFLHHGVVRSGQFVINQTIDALVDADKRQATRLNHTATHLLHAALQKVLGDQVVQKGSLVDDQRLRFDFSYPQAVNADQLHQVEHLVNEQIRLNILVDTQLMAIEEAKRSGAMALFGEKYDEKVRVLTIGDFSKELCGGTHAAQTGDIGLMKITSEGGIAAGIRRIEAVTGQNALQWVEQQQHILVTLSQQIKAPVFELTNKVNQLLLKQRDLEKTLKSLQDKLASQAGNDLLNQAKEIHGVKVLAAKLEGVDANALRDTVDQLKNKLQTAVVVLAVTENEKVSITVGVTKNCIDRIQAGPLANHIAQQVGGKGGGRPDMAQAGGNDPTKLMAALASVNDWVASKLA